MKDSAATDGNAPHQLCETSQGTSNDVEMRTRLGSIGFRFFQTAKVDVEVTHLDGLIAIPQRNRRRRAAPPDAGSAGQPR